MKLSYKCKNSGQKIVIEPDWKNIPEVAKNVIINIFISMKDSECCLKCCPEVGDYDYNL